MNYGRVKNFIGGKFVDVNTSSLPGGLGVQKQQSCLDPSLTCRRCTVG